MTDADDRHWADLALALGLAEWTPHEEIRDYIEGPALALHVSRMSIAEQLRLEKRLAQNRAHARKGE